MEQLENYEKMPGIRKEFLEGMRELQHHDFMQARECFRRLGLKHIPDDDPYFNLYLSYYGLTLILLQEEKGLNLCRRAAHFIDMGRFGQVNEYNSDIIYNLAVAEKTLGNRRCVVDAIKRGLSINSAHRGLNNLQREIGTRRTPIFSSLSRDHFLNRVLGQFFLARPGKSS